MRRAFTQLRNGRPRPVVVEIPLDVFNEEVAEPLTYEPTFHVRSGPGSRRRWHEVAHALVKPSAR